MAFSLQQEHVFLELTPEQVVEYRDRGFLRIPGVFSPEETEELADELDWMISTWATRTEWTGDWRQVYLDEVTEKNAKIDALHDLQFYSAPWARGVAKPSLVRAISQLLDGPVELHHSTMHVKPPETGMPFPMHQDYAFYAHDDDRYVDVLVHLDDTRHENGEIRFLEGSHKAGGLDHVTVAGGRPCTPYLPLEQYRLEDTVAVPAMAGDVVCFNINTIHGSHLNTTARARRLVRVGYRHPDNEQLAGQSAGRPGFVLDGRRGRTAAQTGLVGMGAAHE